MNEDFWGRSGSALSSLLEARKSRISKLVFASDYDDVFGLDIGMPSGKVSRGDRLRVASRLTRCTHCRPV